ncbi:MAG: efflux RND transporter periplasmic adaptor subunit [Acetobacteraceae bacterium]
MDALTREPDIETKPARGRLRLALVWLLCALVLAAIVYAIWFWPAAPTATQASRRSANQTIPVLTAPVVQRDTPIFLDGLGTVQAFQSVILKSMVDGPLVAVNFQEGQNVQKGDVLARIDPRPYQATLDSATAKKAQDEALLANARTDLARYQKLVANNYTSAQQVDTAKAEVARLQALVMQDQAQIDTARTQLDYTTITAPIDGRAGIRQVDVGNIVRASDAAGLVVLTQLQPISVVFTLPQQALQPVQRAMKEGTPTVLALSQSPRGTGSRVLDTGILTVLDNQVDQTTGTIKLKATFPNPDGRLWPGGFVGVRLQIDTLKDATLVPPSAVQRGPNGAYVYVLADGNTVKRQGVRVGHEDEQASVITQGVKLGEHVVVDGASRLTDGSKVAATPATDAADTGSALQQSPPGTRRRRGS